MIVGMSFMVWRYPWVFAGSGNGVAGHYRTAPALSNASMRAVISGKCRGSKKTLDYMNKASYVHLMLTKDQTAVLAEMFHLLGDGSRLGIVLACLDEPVSVGAIAERLELSQSVVSHHLRLLRAARILRAERRGKQVFYSADDAHVRDMLEDMIAHLLEPTGDEGKT